MENIIAIINSKLVLLLVGTLIAAVGLFTWQRRDWIFKNQFLRAQSMLDRRLSIIEKINADVGRLLAAATSVAVVVIKQGAKTQKDDTVKRYNDEQVEWFASYSSHEASLAFYFSPGLSDTFISKIVGAYKKIDFHLSNYLSNPNNKHYEIAYNALQHLRTELRTWNNLALDSLKVV